MHGTRSHTGSARVCSISMDGEDHIRSLIEERLRSVARMGPGSKQELGSTYLREIDLVATALVSVGALERDKAERILDGFRDTLIEKGVIHPRTVLMGTFGDEAPVGPGVWGESLEPSPSPRLVRVVPVVRELGPVAEGPSVTLISAEIWSDHLALRFAMTRTSQNEPVGNPAWTWTIEDDTGTVYERSGGGGSGQDWLWREEHRFRPAPPSDATRLILVARRVGPPRDPSPPRTMWGNMGALGEELFTLEITLDGEADHPVGGSSR